MITQVTRDREITIIPFPHTKAPDIRHGTKTSLKKSYSLPVAFCLGKYSRRKKHKCTLSDKSLPFSLNCVNEKCMK